MDDSTTGPRQKSTDLISVVDAAKRLGIGYTTARRYYRKLIQDGVIEVKQHQKRPTGHQSQCITFGQMEHIRTVYMNPVWYQHRRKPIPSGSSLQEDGIFYLILLVPEFSKSRIKAGFTENMEARLRSHMVSAPTAEVIRTFPCRRSWEGFLLSVVERHGECIRTEVFDVKRLDSLLSDVAKALNLVKKTSTKI